MKAPKKPCPKCKQATTGPCQKCAPPVHIIYGPPGSGKTTFALENMKRGDLILDMDLIFQALSGRGWYDKPRELLPHVLSACDGTINALLGFDRVPAWLVINGKARAERDKLGGMFPGATFHHMDATAAACKKGIRADPRRAPAAWEMWDGRIDRWFREWED